jgi:hypothetical protein
MADITVISRQAEAPGPRTSPSNHGAWLEQLESAQWQQRLRYQPGHGQQQAPSAGADQRAAQQAGRRTGAGDAGQPAQAQRQAGPAAPGSRQAAPAGAQAGPPAAPAAEARPATGAAPPALRQQPAGARLSEGAPWPQPRRLPTVNWEAQNAHVLAGNDGVRVWLRDARCTQAGAGARLLQELRGRFARLGFRLAEFTLNGEQVTGPDQAAQSN